MSRSTCLHEVCKDCGVRYVRTALGDKEAQIKAAGVRCPFFHSGCGEYLTPQLVKDSLVGHGIAASDASEAFSAEEAYRLERFVREASIPYDQLFRCIDTACCWPHRVDASLLNHFGTASASSPRTPSAVAGFMSFEVTRISSMIPTASLSSFRSGRSLAVDDVSVPFVDVDAAVQLHSTPLLQCEKCETRQCVRCNVRWHPSNLTCEEFQVLRSSEGDDGALSVAFANATTKPCPWCGERISHYHGHACHHIRPVTGCPRCGGHFCYCCGSQGKCRRCSLYCKEDNLEKYLVKTDKTPFLHDSRCGCLVCPDCSPGRPCPQCDGTCIVCKGLLALLGGTGDARV